MASRGHKRPEDELSMGNKSSSSKLHKSSSSGSPSSSGSFREASSSSPSSAAALPSGEQPDVALQRDVSRHGGENGEHSSDAAYNQDDPMMRDLTDSQMYKALNDHSNIKELVPSLNDQSDPSAQLASLTQLCQVLSLLPDHSLSPLVADQLAPVLVILANHESSPDIMLFAIRAITYLCEISSNGLASLVRQDVVPALCRRLTALEYIDVAEQCFLALKRISNGHPLPCLQSGAVGAVMGFIDFFSTHTQRNALSTVVNICKKLPADLPPLFMDEAVPRLCNLLQCEDQQLVESAITCLINIANRVKNSPKRLEELCKHGLVHKTMHLIGVSSQGALSPTTYARLIGLLANLVAGSSDALSMIFELDIGNTLKNSLSNYNLSHGAPLPHSGWKPSIQVHEVLRFLNELLPTTNRHQKDQILSSKEKILADHPDGLQRFAVQVLPALIQVVNSGAGLSVFYGLLSVISKFIYYSKSEMLLEMIDSTGMASFLTGAFFQNDDHILTLVLEITEMVLQKLPDIVVSSFAKEGIFYTIDSLVNPEKPTPFMLASASRDSVHSVCLCSLHRTSKSQRGPNTCKLEKNSVEKAATRIRMKYNLGNVESDVLQNLREASSELNSLIDYIRNGESRQSEEKLNSMLQHVTVLIIGDEPISTFELIESGIIKALVNYLYVGLYEGEEVDLSGVSVNFDLLLKRFETFARVSLSSFSPAFKESSLCLLVRKLQIALSSLERFSFTSGAEPKPVILEKTELDNTGTLCKTLAYKNFPLSYDMVVPKVSSGTVRSSPTNDILLLLRSLEIINRHSSNLGYSERVGMFAKGKCNDICSKSIIPKLSQNEFINSKLSEKLDHQLRDPSVVSLDSVPLWRDSLMSKCPFLFSLEARCRFFQLLALGGSQTKSRLPRIKFSVDRERILQSATSMMAQNTLRNAALEVEFHQEVGTGLGPTLEFFTMVCHEFQKPGLGMWREDHQSSEYVTSPHGLFPRPWPVESDASNGTIISDVINRFSLLGWIMAKALQDGRILDIPLSKPFLKLILGQDLGLYDFLSFDPVFGKTLLEFHAIVRRQQFQINAVGEDLTSELDLSFHGISVEDLCLDFTLPGYADYVLEHHSMVTIGNLEEYVSLVLDATLNAGIFRQVEAFKSGFNKVFPITNLQMFNEHELERSLCGEHDSWVTMDLLDYCKIDHGYTANSTPIQYLLEILQEFSYKQRRAFLQFVTGSPRLPPGGLGALNPRLTIVRKEFSNFPDWELPSVMTCTKYLKLPPYSSKEVMKEKLLYAITEGQGAFHLS